MVFRRVHRFTKKIGISREHPPEDKIVHNTQIIILYAVALMFIVFLYTVPVLKVPGKYVGAGMVYLDKYSYESFALQALDMDLDFILVQTTDPETISLCYQDERKYGIKCIISEAGIVQGKQLNICSEPKVGCEAFDVHVPEDLKRSIMSCDSIVGGCNLRPFPLWHQVVLKYAVLAYLLYAAVSITLREKTFEQKLAELGRRVI